MEPTEAAQRFALALPGAWLVQNNGSFAHFGGRPAGPANRAWARRVLRDSWGVDGPAALRTRVQWLLNEGHSAEYAASRAEWATMSPKERQGRLQTIFVDTFQAEIGERGLLAWDLARAINVAGWGFLAGWYTEAEAWEVILPAAARCQATYTSWEEFGRHYVVASAYWSAPASEKNGAAVRALLEDPTSAWCTVPWATPLGGKAAKRKEESPSESGGWGGWLAAIGCGLLLVLGVGGVVLAGLAFLFLGGVGTFFVARDASTAPIASPADPSITAPAAVEAAPPPGPAGSWDGQAPFVCSGNQKVTLNGVKAKLSTGPAILAKGNCQLTLIDVDVEAPVAVKGEGNATITVQGGRLVGKTAAVQATALSKFKLTGTKLEGKVDRKGGAKVEGP